MKLEDLYPKNYKKIPMSQIFHFRYYQIDAIESIKESYKSGDTDVLLELPQGSGKSVIIRDIANHFVRMGRCVVITTDRLILLAQLKEGLHTNVTIMSRGSLANSKTKFDVIIIDEAHNCNYEYGQYDAIRSANDAYVIGFTATPYRLDHGYIVPKIFSKLIYSIDRETLIDAGFLAPRKFHHIPTHFLINVRPAEYLAQESIGNVAKEKTEAIIEYIETLNLVGKTIIFGVDIVHCLEICNLLCAKSKVVASCFSVTDNNNIIAEFKYWDLDIIISCMMLNVGFDAPMAVNIVNLRPTTSYTLYEQLIGRGDRPFKGKTHNNIYDFTFNSLDFGKQRDHIAVCVECGLDTDNRLHKCENCSTKIVRMHMDFKPKICQRCSFENQRRARFCQGCSAYLVEPSVLWTRRGFVEVRMYTKGKTTLHLYAESKRGLTLNNKEAESMLVWLGFSGYYITPQMAETKMYTIFMKKNLLGKISPLQIVNYKQQVLNLKGCI